MDGCCERRLLPNTELEKLGGEGKGQEWMKVKDQEGQGPLWAVVPLLNEPMQLYEHNLQMLFKYRPVS
jgi:hypothetical protein